MKPSVKYLKKGSMADTIIVVNSNRMGGIYIKERFE